jgi:hypothetical protein
MAKQGKSARRGCFPKTSRHLTVFVALQRLPSPPGGAWVLLEFPSTWRRPRPLPYPSQ